MSEFSIDPPLSEAELFGFENIWGLWKDHLRIPEEIRLTFKTNFEPHIIDELVKQLGISPERAEQISDYSLFAAQKELDEEDG